VWDLAQCSEHLQASLNQTEEKNANPSKSLDYQLIAVDGRSWFVGTVQVQSDTSGSKYWTASRRISSPVHFHWVLICTIRISQNHFAPGTRIGARLFTRAEDQHRKNFWNAAAKNRSVLSTQQQCWWILTGWTFCAIRKEAVSDLKHWFYLWIFWTCTRELHCDDASVWRGSKYDTCLWWLRAHAHCWRWFARLLARTSTKPIVFVSGSISPRGRRCRANFDDFLRDWLSSPRLMTGVHWERSRYAVRSVWDCPPLGLCCILRAEQKKPCWELEQTWVWQSCVDSMQFYGHLHQQQIIARVMCFKREWSLIRFQPLPQATWLPTYPQNTTNHIWEDKQWQRVSSR
jgi:hypothetical protein